MQEKITFKCKPCYNFQSVEFEYTIDTPEEIDTMMNIYNMILQNLISIAPNQEAKEPEVKEEPASEKQLELMKKLKITAPENCTKEQARVLIAEVFNKNKQ